MNEVSQGERQEHQHEGGQVVQEVGEPESGQGENHDRRGQESGNGSYGQGQDKGKGCFTEPVVKGVHLDHGENQYGQHGTQRVDDDAFPLQERSHSSAEPQMPQDGSNDGRSRHHEDRS